MISTGFRDRIIVVAIYASVFPAIAVMSYMVADRRMPTLDAILVAALMGYLLLLLPGIITALADLSLRRQQMLVRLLVVVPIGVGASLVASAVMFNGLTARVPGLAVFTALASLCCCFIVKARVEAARSSKRR